MKLNKISKKTLAAIIATTSTLTVIFTSIYTSVYYNYYTINTFATIILPAIVSAVSTAIPIYISIKWGIPKEFEVALNMVEKRVSRSPTAKRLFKVMKMSDKLFGDEQAVEQITGFFKEARELVSSPEAKNFFANVTELMKDLGSEKKVELKMPKKEVKKLD